jgi:hypothetical protein
MQIFLSLGIGFLLIASIIGGLGFAFIGDIFGTIVCFLLTGVLGLTHDELGRL